jgi:hypothetical protein
VQNSQDLDVIADFVNGYEREGNEHELSRSINTTWSPSVGKRVKRSDRLSDGLGDSSRGLRAILSDVVANPFQVVDGIRRPPDAHQPR